MQDNHDDLDKKGEVNNIQNDKQRESWLITNTPLDWIAWISFAGMFLGFYISYALDKEANPVFKVISDVAITERGEDSKIKVYYDSIEVQNVRAVTIAFWNAGDAFLDKSHFSKDRPITIVNSKSAKILDFKQINVSRRSLSFDVILHLQNQSNTPIDTINGSTDFATLEINGDDGLEAGDGAVFRILYTSNAKENGWVFLGRIKGIAAGFKPAIGRSYQYAVGVDLLFPLLILIFSYFFVRYIAKELYTPKFRTVFSLLLLIYLLFLGLFYFNYVHPYLNNSVELPETLTKSTT